MFPSIFTHLALMAFSCYGQTPQAAATPDELKYFRFVLMQIANIDQHPKASVIIEDNLTRLHGLNSQEIAIFRGAGQELRGLLQQLRPVGRSIGPDRTGNLSPANKAALAALAAQRDQKIEILANRILGQVRPQVAAHFRLHGRFLANPANRPSARR